MAENISDIELYFRQNGRHLFEYRFPSVYSEETIRYGVDYKPQNDDIFVVTNPKCGTTWTQHIMCLIISDGVPEDYYKRSCLEECGHNCMRRPVIKTHLPIHLLPMNPMAKYVFVFRNPKDTVVSLYYYLKNDSRFGLELDFHQYFQIWIKGMIAYCNYFERTLHYWSHRLDDNILCLIYERMKCNPKETALKIANFLGNEFVDKLMANNEMVLNQVLKYSTIESMKNITGISGTRLRKGIVGDWRSHLTRDESDLIDQKVDEYFAGTELQYLWLEDMKWY